MKITQVYVTYSTTDEYGRRGSRNGIFTTRSKADKEAIGIGWWGGTGTVVVEHAITVDGISYLLSSPEPIELDVTSDEVKAMKEKLKRKALAKLTSEERKALGV
jgi:hypothetical protein